MARPITLPAATCDDLSHTLLPTLERALAGQGPAVAPHGSPLKPGPDLDGTQAVPAAGGPLDQAVARPLADPIEVGALAGPAEAGIAVVMPTSGSTGEPKLVMLSAAALQASADATHERLGGPGTWLLALPATRIAGLQVLVRSLLAGTTPEFLLAGTQGPRTQAPSTQGPSTQALSAQGSSVQGPGARDAEFAGAFTIATRRLQRRTSGGHATGRTYTALVPVQLARLLRAGGEAVEALATYDAVLLGGGATAPALLDSARTAGVRVITTYGMTETCGGCVYDGLPLRDVRIDLDKEGRVRIAGPVLFSGYHGRPDLTAEALAGGRHVTRDLGRFDPAGRLEVLGRVDDVVISGGVNVPLPAVERAVLGLPGVAEAVAVGVPDPDWGTRVVAYVVPEPSAAAPSLAEVRARVAAEHPRAYAPKEVHLLSELPLLASGKPDRTALLTTYRSEGRGNV